MDAQNLIDTAASLVAGDKALLATSESTPTCNKRFAARLLRHDCRDAATG